MKTVFADTGYWVALLNPYDELHKRASHVSQSFGQICIVTSEMVLVELLNYYAERGTPIREAAAKLARKLQDNPNVVVVPQTSIQYTKGLDFYADRSDKGWSHTDCCSFKIMQEQEMTEALTYDKHFEQAGFLALLRETGKR